MLSVSRSLIVALVCIPTLAVAQVGKDAGKAAKPPALAPVSTNPERTTASFGDWVMRCESVGSPAKRICEAAHIITVQGQANPIAQVAIGKPEPTGSNTITLVLPANVALTVKPQLNVAKSGAALLDLVWQRCTPGGCFASAPIPDGALFGFGAETEPGRILFKDAADRDIALPLAFRGLAQALEALAKER